VDFDIRALDLTTNTPIMVSDAPGNQLNAAMEGSLVAYFNDTFTCQDSGCPPPGIVAKDLSTGKTYNVASSGPETALSAGSPAVTGRVVAWVEHDANGQSIMAKNVDTGAVVKVREAAQGEYTVAYLQASRGVLAWAELVYSSNNTGTRYTVNKYDLATGTLSQVVSYVVPPSGKLIPGLVMNSGKLGLVDEGGNLVIVDLLTGNRTRLPYSGDASYAALQGERVLIHTKPGSFGGDVLLFDLANLQKAPVPVLVSPPGITPKDAPNYAATIAGDWLVWIDLNGRNTGLKVKSLTAFAQPPSIPLPAEFKSQVAPAASNRYLVWEEGQPSPLSGVPARDFDIRGVDLQTNVPFTVTTAPGDQLSAAVSDDIAAWISTTECPQCPAPGVYARDLASGREYTVASGRKDRSSLVASG
jgi:hypothetical protein